MRTPTSVRSYPDDPDTSGHHRLRTRVRKLSHETQAAPVSAQRRHGTGASQLLSMAGQSSTDPDVCGRSRVLSLAEIFFPSTARQRETTLSRPTASCPYVRGVMASA